MTAQENKVSRDNSSVFLHEGWQLTGVPAGSCATPDELANFATQWHDAIVPGTVATSLHHDINAAGNYDADDWWYRTSFRAPTGKARSRYYLRFEGLATLAEVWLNGTSIVSSRNMFVSHRIDVTDLVRNENSLLIVFRSLAAALAQRQPRPRWKTALVEQQNLRWFRTTLLGRIPGWTPPITPVGPWGPITLERVDQLEIHKLQLQARADGRTGHVQFRALVSFINAEKLEGAQLRVGDLAYTLEAQAGAQIEITGDLTIANPPLWWPHTHGSPALLPCVLELRLDERTICIDCGFVGFKQTVLDQSAGRTQFVVNGVPVFCRGACWTPVDFLSLRGQSQALRQRLVAVRDAGMNMLRVGGTMVYESDEFYELCDELGILVWQDFMFANMDYPVGDKQFRAEIEAEVKQQLDRMHRHVSIAAYCGGSEIAQQAAMLGLPAADWTNDFFADTLPRLCAERHAGIPYFPSTPWGGALPFHVGTGISHYYGVGAYRRPLSDVKAARVKFTSECLGFSNVPDPETVALVLNGTTPAPHHPRWKMGVPRDSGAGWDFEDIRDFYVQLLFGIDPVALRSIDMHRYYAVSRAVTGEVMQRVFSEWRSPSSTNGGALVWFLSDLRPGAGWGVIDSTGRPKAAYWYLRRVFASQAICITDEGLDGLNVHVLNEGPESLDAQVEIEMFQNGRTRTGAAERQVTLSPRAAITLQADELLGYFSDSTAVYRFGPAKQDVIVVRLKRRDTGAVLSEDSYFPCGMSLMQQHGAHVRTQAEWSAADKVVVKMTSDTFLQTVSASCNGFTPDDNYFHLAPGQEKSLVFSAEGGVTGKFRVHFDALNLAETITVRADRSSNERIPDDLKSALH